MAVDQNNSIAILIKKLALEYDKLSSPLFAKYDLSPSQYKILIYIYQQEGQTARVVDLEKAYSMTHPTAIGLLRHLDKKGFTHRIDNPDDGRGRLAALTPKSISLQKELEALGDHLEETFAANLTEDERAELIRLLNKLMDSKNDSGDKNNGK